MNLLSGTANLVEIDLLRSGARFPTATPLPAAPYFVLVSRSQRRQDVEVWSIALEAPLPTIRVPLLPGDPDTSLDLQAALTTIYDILGYDACIDYQVPPLGPLTEAEAAWVHQVLQKAEKRNGSQLIPILAPYVPIG